MSAETLAPTARHGSGAPADPSPRTSGAPTALAKVWGSVWPKLLAVFLAIAVWQVVVWAEWKEEYLLPPPSTVFGDLADLAQTEYLWRAIGTTMQRGAVGFAFSLVFGTLLGIAVSQSKILRSGVGSMITGLQTMPSIAWFPFAMLIFGTFSPFAIMFVIVLGAAPSIANGVISGIDEVPPPLLRAGHMLGARGVNRYRYVVLPAALPSYLAGLKQGWAFAWRSLMAGELIVQLSGEVTLGGSLNDAQVTGRADDLMAFMIIILILGMAVDGIFSAITDRVRTRRGLTGFTG
jgi:NitT/TauT family transport system permease protein